MSRSGLQLFLNLPSHAKGAQTFADQLDPRKKKLQGRRDLYIVRFEDPAAREEALSRLQRCCSQFLWEVDWERQCIVARSCLRHLDGLGIVLEKVVTQHHLLTRMFASAKRKRARGHLGRSPVLDLIVQYVWGKEYFEVKQASAILRQRLLPGYER